jgi:hypothetical protein
MTTTPRLAADETYVDGRSSKRAAELLGYAKESGAIVRTTSHGYIVPTAILPDGFDGETLTEESRPAVHTEPGTDPDAANVYNVGQAPAHDTFAQAEEPAEEFDPSKATVDEVIAYLDGADEAEVERVLAAEADGKNRKGIAEYTTEGEK